MVSAIPWRDVEEGHPLSSFALEPFLVFLGYPLLLSLRREEADVVDFGKPTLD